MPRLSVSAVAHKNEKKVTERSATEEHSAEAKPVDEPAEYCLKASCICHILNMSSPKVNMAKRGGKASFTSSCICHILDRGFLKVKVAERIGEISFISSFICHILNRSSSRVSITEGDEGLEDDSEEGFLARGTVYKVIRS
jgi:hypothetical protein